MLNAAQHENRLVLRDNIRVLVGRFPSISAASVALKINRQQLNKYLSGISVPSVRTLTLFSTYFHISVNDLLSRPVFNSKLYDSDKSSNQERHGILESIAKKRLQEAVLAKEGLSRYCGLYHRISFLPMMDYKIAKAITVIYQLENLTYATTLEVFDNEYNLSAHKKFIRRSNAIISEYNDRIYFLDPGQEKRYLSMIAYPSAIPVFKYLSGFAMSVSDYGSRKIFCIPFLLQALGKRPVTISDLRSCGIFDRDGPEITDEIRVRLSTLT